MAKKQIAIHNEEIKCGDCINSYDHYNWNVDKTKYLIGKCKKRTTEVFLFLVEKDCPYAVSRLGINNKQVKK